MNYNNFSRTEEVLNRLREITRCQLCKKLKDGSSMLFYRSCDHFYCMNCAAETSPCFICDKEKPPVKLINDKNMLALYQSALNLKLPSKETIAEIIKKDAINDEEADILPKKTQRKSRKTANTVLAKEGSPAMLNSRDSFEQANKTTKLKDSSKMQVNLVSDSKVGEEAIKQNKEKLNVLETPAAKNVLATTKSTTPNTTSRSKLNVNKRNPKGETPLHLAGKKGNLVLMKELIDAGANPNAQDNAGWTPLHDAIAKDNLSVIEFLLDNGAKVNTPGLENNTGLHQAVLNGNINVVKLLLRNGADPHSRNMFGETPLDIAKKYSNAEVEKVLMSNNTSTVKADVKSTPSRQNERFLIWGCNLNADQNSFLNKFTEFCNSKVVKLITGKVPVTHIVVSQEFQINLDWNLVSLVCCGSWVVSYKWVSESLKEKRVKPAEIFELDEDLFCGFKKARCRNENQLPGLFSGCHFFFGGFFPTYRVGDMNIEREELKSLIERNGGQILKRSPDPESLALERTVPYHAPVNSSVAKTSYYIIYQSDKWDPKPKYNMKHMKTLPVDWLITCIIKFEIVDPEKEKFNFKR